MGEWDTYTHLFLVGLHFALDLVLLLQNHHLLLVRVVVGVVSIEDPLGIVSCMNTTNAESA